MTLVTGILAAPVSSHGRGPSFSPYEGRIEPQPSFSAHSESIIVLSDSIRIAPTTHIDPSKAMYRSLMIPGYGQLSNGKKWKAALFFTAEASFLTGYLYMNHRVKNDDVDDWERTNLRTDRNSFIMYWLGAKVLGLVDAYVDAHLVDFDVDDITPEVLRKP